MNKFLNIKYNADAGLSSGGSPEVSAPQTAQVAQSEAVPASPAANNGQSVPAPEPKTYDSGFFMDLEKKSDKELGEIPGEVLDQYTKWNESGRKMTPSSSANKSAETKTTETPVKGESPEPKGDPEIAKLVEGKASNTWTEAEAQAVRTAMEKVGAKTPQELLQKAEGALALAGKKGQEAGNLEVELADYRQLVSDLVAGKPEAITYLIEEKGMSRAQAVAFQKDARNEQNAPVKPSEAPETDAMPDGIIDEVAWKEFNRQRKADKELIQKLMEKVEGFGKTFEEQEAIRVQKEQDTRRERAISAARDEYIESFLNLATQNPETYGVKSGNLRKMLVEHYYEGKTDPRLGNHMELAKFAAESQIFNLDHAHAIKDRSSLSKKLIEAEQRGRDSVLNQGRSQGLSAVRNSAAGGDPQSNYSLEDVQRMNEGRMDPPKEWFEKGQLMKSKVPEQFHKLVFG